MSYYNIQRLDELTKTLKNSNKSIDSLVEIRNILYDISVGIGTDQRQRTMLQCILSDLSNLSGGYLRSNIRRVVERIRRDRRQIAESFYSAHNQSQGSINAIDLDNELETLRLPRGKTLYQWCIPLVDKYSPPKVVKDGKLVDEGFEVFQDKKGYSICLGKFYSPSIIDIERLGASPLHDIWYGDKYLGTGTRKLYRFVLPFDADCLKSTAGSAYDTWSAYINCDGSIIQGQGFGCQGGAVQYFMPLDDDKEKKRLLAKTGEWIR